MQRAIFFHLLYYVCPRHCRGEHKKLSLFSASDDVLYSLFFPLHLRHDLGCGIISVMLLINMMRRLKIFAKGLFSSTNTTFITLLKIMVPALIVIKVLEEIGAVTWLAEILDPVMGPIGLPGEAGIIWATCLVANIFTALMVFFTQIDYSSFTVMQASILASLMLIGHTLIVEGAISAKVGLNWGLMIVLRIGGALLFGWLVNITCTELGLLQQPLSLDFVPQPKEDQGLWGWALDQLYGLVFLYVVLLALILLIRIMNKIGLNSILERALAPVLVSLGISKRAAPMTLIGMTLGLTYGSGLLIHEAQKDSISKRDIFLSICLISLCHSLIEDTLIVMLIGANLWVIVFFRLLFALGVVFLINLFVRRRVNTKKQV